MSQSLRAEFRLEALGFNHPDPEVFVRSQWRCRRSVYLAWRVLWLLWHLAITSASAVNFRVNVAHSGEGGARWLLYFPHLTFLLTVLACTCDLIGAVRAGPLASQPYSSDTAASSRGQDKEEILFHGEFTIIEGLKQAPTPGLSRLTWCLYSVTNAANLMSSACYWAVTFHEHSYAVEMVAHVTNSLFVLTNLLVSAAPVRLLHLVYPATWAGLYLALTAIHQAAGGHAIYRPLDWDHAFPAALVAVAWLVVIAPLLHAVTFAAYTFRVYLHSRLHSASYSPRAEFEAKVPPVTPRPEEGGGSGESRAPLETGSAASACVYQAGPHSSGE